MKKKYDVFPIKLTAFGLVLLVAVYFAMFNVNSKNKELISAFYSSDVPSLQIYSGISRLIAINQILERNENGNSEEIKMNRNGIIYALAEMNNVAQGRLRLKPTVKKILDTKTPQEISAEELGHLKNELQDFIENDLNDKNAALERQTKISAVISTIGIIGIIIFLSIIINVYRIYLRNLNNLDALTTSLEEQRARSVESAKLASLGEMASGMAHEINNPLAIITFNIRYMFKVFDKEQIHSEKLMSCARDIEST